jgi:hypothetical protein
VSGSDVGVRQDADHESQADVAVKCVPREPCEKVGATCSAGLAGEPLGGRAGGASPGPVPSGHWSPAGPSAPVLQLPLRSQSTRSECGL